MNSFLHLIQGQYGWMVWAGLAIVAGLGILAVVSPRYFAVLAQRGGTWVDTNRMLEKFERRIDIDHYAIRHSRVFGVVIIVAVLFVAYSYCRWVLGVASPF